MLMREDQMQTKFTATVQDFASVLRDEVAEFVNENEKWRSLVRPAAKRSGHQLVHQQGSQQMLIVFRNGILPREIYEENFSIMQDRGEIDGLGMLAQDGADNFVFYKWLDAVERGFNSLFPFIDLHALQPLPLRPDTRIGNAPADGGTHGTGTWIHQMLGLDERETGRNQGVGDIKKPAC